MKKSRKTVKKAKRVKPIPAGDHSVTPYLACGDAARAIEFYKKAFGDMGTVQDPFGHVWHLATHTEDLSMAELRKRGEKAMKEMSG